MATKCMCLALIAAAVPCHGQQTVYATTLALSLSFDEQVLYLALQGHVNGNDSFTSPAGGRMWLYEPVFWTNNASTYIFPAYLTAAKGFTFVNSTNFCTAFQQLGAQPTGLVLYNATHLEAQRWLALTSAGLLSALPVSAAILLNETSYSCLHNLPVLVDYSDEATYNFSSDVDAASWGMAHLLPSCSADRAYSGGHSYTDDYESVNLGSDAAIDIGLDLAVAQKMYVFNLSPNGVRYPPHAAAFAAIVAALRARTQATGDAYGIPSIFGWGEPEDDFTGVASANGAAVVCDAAPNLSLWARVALEAPVHLPFFASGEPLDASAYYLAFQANEGDTPKILAGLMQGAWLDARRGSVPIAWGINPLIVSIVPALLEYYTTTARPNDTWFAATAGAGYAYPLMMPNNASYVARAANLIRNVTTGWPLGTMEVDVWDSNTPAAYAQYADWANGSVGMFSLQPEELQGMNARLPDAARTPLVVTTHFGNGSDLWYPTLSSVDPWGDLEQRLRALVNAHPPPFFMLVYGNLLDGNGFNILDYALQMQTRLADANVRVVGMQDMVRLAQAGVGITAPSSVV